MDEALEVTIPLINPNEPEAQISALPIADGQHVSEGDLLCSVETTKATNDVLAPAPGYVAGLRWEVGARVLSGQRLCWLAQSEGWEPPEDQDAVGGPADLPSDLRITQPAAELARQSDLDFADLPTDQLVTEAVVLEILASTRDAAPASAEVDLSSGDLIIYGGGGHGKSLIDLIQVLDSFDIVGIVDDGLPVGEAIMGVAVIGSAHDLPEMRQKGIQLAVNAVGGIGDIGRRIEVFRRLMQAGFAFPSVVHPTAFIEPSAELQRGVQVFPHAYIGSEVQVGFGVIVNTAAVISHDCKLAAYVNIAPGTQLAGGVTVEQGVLVGMGVSVNLNVHIGARAMIGNSAVIKADVPPGQIVRAGQVWPD
jgi:sugar O-acyltransferase (sialic acid O-acetyltransferase NeuD family)